MNTLNYAIIAEDTLSVAKIYIVYDRYWMGLANQITLTISSFLRIRGALLPCSFHKGESKKWRISICATTF